MCSYNDAPVIMICGHPGPERPIKIKPCNKHPCETGGTPKANRLGSTKKREPCDDCIANGSWIKVAGSFNQWEPLAK